MATEADWFHNDALLLETLKETQRPSTKAMPVIPGYAELREICRGGQGIVFNAIQRSTRREVAIKVLLDGAWASETRRRRFEREIELIAALRHPNIVRLYDSGLTDAGYPYYVMEFIDGVGLDKLAGGGAWSTGALGDETPEVQTPILPLRAALELFAKVCEAVHYAHQRGVIHRDLKPSNVRVGADGEPFVLDFGLAKASTSVRGDRPDYTVSRTGEFMGSLPWASPEQAEGNPHAIDIRSDVYSLGVVLFQILTGQFPYSVRGNLRAVLDNVQNAQPQKPSKYRRDLDDEVDTIVLKCLAKEPERRYQTAGELARDVRHYLAGEAIAAKRDSTLYNLRKAMRHYKYAARMASVVVVLALGAAVIMSFLLLRAEEAVQRAARQAHETEATVRQRLEQQAARARSINEFLLDVLATPTEQRGDARVADTLARAAVELERAADLDPQVEATLRQTIGSAYAGLGLRAEAETHLLKSYEVMRAALGHDDPDTRRHLSRLILFYEEGGETAKAERYRARLRSTGLASPDE